MNWVIFWILLGNQSLKYTLYKCTVKKILVQGKNGPGGPFLVDKIWSGGPNLVAKIGPAQPKMVRYRKFTELIATTCCKWYDHTLN